MACGSMGHECCLVPADWTKAKILYGLQTATQFHQHIAVWWGSAHVVAAAAGGAAFIFSTASGKVGSMHCGRIHQL